MSAMVDDGVSVTEASNPISEGLDISSPEVSLSIIHRCEMQIFGGPHGAGVFDLDFAARLLDLSQRMQRRPDLPILLAGAGTSGRLCRLVTLASAAPSRVVRSALPGGTHALVRAKPLGEDSDDDGAAAAESIRYPRSDGCFAIGVTCGLTAKYVEGFIGAALSFCGPGATSILGFNPASAARIDLFTLDPRNVLLNPIVGPEAVRGSVRMKSGTATLAILHAALHAQPNQAMHRLEDVQTALHQLTIHHDFAAELVSACAMSIRNGGHIYVLGAAELGAIGLFDAAECVPTFSADPQTYRGFVEGGWNYLEGGGKAEQDFSIEISIDYYLRTVAPHLGAADTVILLASKGFKRLAVATAESANAGSRFIIDVSIDCNISSARRFMRSGPLPGEGWIRLIALRSLLSRISTASFAASGSLYGNRMVDLRITNRKLLRRAIDLVAELAKVSPKLAFDAIVRAHDQLAAVPATMAETDAFILRAATTTRLVSRALLLLNDDGVSPRQAQEMAATGTAVRALLARRSDQATRPLGHQ